MLIFGFYSSLISLGDFTFFSACLLLFCICMNFASILDGQLHFLFDCTIHKFFFYGLVINFFFISLLSNLTRKWKKKVWWFFFQKKLLVVKILKFHGKNYNSLKWKCSIFFCSRARPKAKEKGKRKFRFFFSCLYRSNWKNALEKRPLSSCLLTFDNFFSALINPWIYAHLRSSVTP